MPSKTKPALTPAPCTITYIKGKKHMQVHIASSSFTDWIDKQELQTAFHISNRTLQTLRTNKKIPYSTIGGKILYYVPGILAMLQENMFS